MLHFAPKDNLSKQLLKTIPKKVVAWLDNLGISTHGDSQFGDLRWSFDIERSHIKLISPDISISWTGPADSPNWIAGSDQRFENLTENMDFFVHVEQSIYDVLEQLQLKMQEDALNAPDRT